MRGCWLLAWILTRLPWTLDSALRKVDLERDFTSSTEIPMKLAVSVKTPGQSSWRLSLPMPRSSPDHSQNQFLTWVLAPVAFFTYSDVLSLTGGKLSSYCTSVIHHCMSYSKHPCGLTFYELRAKRLKCNGVPLLPPIRLAIRCFSMRCVTSQYSSYACHSSSGSRF